MLNKAKKCGKVIVIDLAIAFFFASLLVLAVNFLFKEQLSTYIRLFNKIAVTTTNNTYVSNVEIKMDSDTQKLTTLPAYGEKFGTIEIPAINIEINLFNGDSLGILKKGAGRYIGSFFPGEGKPIVIAAHNKLEYFGNLYKLKNGDIIEIHANYGEYTYEVTEGMILKESELNKELNSFLEIEGENLLLYTCYPTESIGYRYKRYVIIAKRINGGNV